MKWFGSVTNRLMESAKQMTPVVGMGCTEILWSDLNPYEVIEVRDARHCKVRSMNVKHIGGDYENKWEITSDPDGSTAELFLTAKGQWVERVGRKQICKFYMGRAEKYYDYEF